MAPNKPRRTNETSGAMDSRSLKGPFFEVPYTWFGLFAPKGLDPAIAQKMNLAIKTALADPDAQKKLVELGNTPRYETIEQFQATVKRDRAKWADVVKAVGAKVE